VGQSCKSAHLGKFWNGLAATDIFACCQIRLKTAQPFKTNKFLYLGLSKQNRWGIFEIPLGGI
jgi:hypothetical protein